MNTGYRTLFSALALAATLCWQAPAFADPPSWAHGEAGRGRSQDRPDDRASGYGERRNDQDNRYAHGWGRDDHPYYNGYYNGVRYPRYPAYAGYPVRPIYPLYSAYRAYPRYPGYYYPSYYAYYGVPVYRGYYAAPYYGAYGPCNPGLGAAGAVTGAIIGNSASAPGNRAVGTVVGAIAGGIIGTAVGGCR